MQKVRVSALSDAQIAVPRPSCEIIPFIGDLSATDGLLLRDLSAKAKRILEFGSGGSTQILSHYSSPEIEIISVETHEIWIRKTQENLRRLVIPKPVHFILWDRQPDPLAEIEGTFDLIFVDGNDALRSAFYRMAWEKTPIGGIIASHDTRRPQDFQIILEFLQTHWLEVESLQINHQDSNITLLKRGPRRDYEDWNQVEKKLPWQYGAAEPPEIN